MGKASSTICHTKVILRKPPKNIAPQDEHIFKENYKAFIQPHYYTLVKNVYVSPQGLILRRGMIRKQFLNPIYTRPNLTRQIHLFLYFVKKHIQKNVVHLDDDAYIFFDNFSNNYYHWFTETLPRLFALQNDIKNRICLLPSNLKDFQRRSLAYFDLNRIQYIKEDCILKANNLLIPSYTGTPNDHDGEIINAISSFYIGKILKAPLSTHKLIYISRRKASHRRVLNEQQIINMLQRYGFEILCLEDYSFEEQVSLFNQTKILIAPHGAGLTNMIFMNMRSSVIEILHPGYLNLCYFNLANVRDINYYYLVSEQYNKNNKWDWNGDIFVNISKLEKIVEPFL